MMLVQQHNQIAMMGLGKLKNPQTDSVSVDLGSAKYAIDTLSMLEKYTEGNLPGELKGYLAQNLSTLRLNYVDVSSAEEKKEEAADSADSAEAADVADEDASTGAGNSGDADDTEEKAG